MEWVKTTAKTLPEAIDLALDNLGVDESEAEIVVLEEPRAGLFGRMRGTARVEARVKPKPIRPKNERSRNRRNRSEDGSRNRGRKKGRRQGGGRGDGGGDGQGGRSENRGGRGDRSRDRAGDQRKRNGGRQEGTGGDRSGKGGTATATDRGSDERRSESGESRGQGGSSGNRKRRRRRSGKGGGQARTQGQAREGERASGSSEGRGEQGAGKKRGPTSSGSNGGEAKPSEGATVEEVATHVRTFLTDLIEAFGLDGDVTIDDSEEGTVIGRIEGRHGLLVGPKGRTLDAVQELARISCQRSAPNNLRIKIDVGDYRAQRSSALANFAEAAADRAVSEGVEVTLEPMSPADRKSVHDALNGDDRVETRSVGAEPRRRVVVVPLDAGDESDDEDIDDEDGGDERDGVSEGAVDDGLSEVEDGPEDRVRGDDEE